ncbi:fimbria/pilus outer membrane usher protein [Pseudomonas sp. RIT-PI-AD]|uniref:fimbria/pilus outer membrane usher protein n=1 Tax=Pseudomonas sp. RIT-PI-AD TaxID=3035294 RepID=UPI0021DA4D83|nr:fimbria/pilus outer membrane usher protein [Pseudomonas sp. RIT-PI-AD]
MATLLSCCLTTALAGEPENEPMELFLEMVVNQMPTGRVVAVSARGGRYFVARDDLRAVGVALEGTGDEDPLALDRIPGLQSRYEASSQRLELTLPADWLPRQELGRRRVHDYLPAQSSLGALFNYDLYYSSTERGSKSANAFLEQRVFGGFGVLSNTGTYREHFSGNGFGDGYIRYDTQWSQDDQENLTAYTLGDLVTGALTWNTSVRMGGVQVSRDFGLRPDLITYPLPSFSGDASIPTTLDLFIDNSQVSSDTLNPGPFTVNNVPFISGAGTATLVTTDALGRRVSTRVPFYVTDTLLQQGLFDYSLSVGKLRREYGVENFTYGSAAASGTARYGLNDRVTLEGHVEDSQDLTLAGLGGTFGIGRWGVFGTSLTQSRSLGESGRQLSLGYSYYSRRFGIAMQHIDRDPGYVDLGVIGARESRARASYLPSSSDQATFSYSPGELGKLNLGTLGVGYFETRNPVGSRTRLVNLSWSQNLFRQASFYLSFNRVLGGEGYSAQMQFVVPFDLHSTLNVGVERNRRDGFAERVAYSRSVSSEGGLGWNLGYAGSGYRQADVTWRTRYVQLQGGAYTDAGRATHWGEASGSLVWMNDALFASNRISDAFVLVDTAGFAGVPVRFEHQPLGTTNANGHLLVPWVPSYYRGQYEVDLLDLPANVRSDELSQFLAVRQGAGALLKFPLQAVTAASIVLIDSRGTPLPRGTPVRDRESRQTAYVGWDGLVYFEHLQAHNRLDVELPDGTRCASAFDLDTQSDQLALVGPLVCR